jgi:hypothetical protein
MLCCSPMDVIQKLADCHESFEVFIRDDDAEAVFGRDSEIDLGERIQTQVLAPTQHNSRATRGHFGDIFRIGSGRMVRVVYLTDRTAPKDLNDCVLVCA